MTIRSSAAWCLPCVVLTGLCGLWLAPDADSDDRAERNGTVSFATLQAEFVQDVQPIIQRYCLDCHTTLDKQGELDLERFANFDAVRTDPPAWQKVAHMLANGEMPPEDADQPDAAERQLLEEWVGNYLDAEAFANAGDPGPVVLRRLNNAEYTYTIQDLTGIPIEPAREFPIDGAAGEGFTNTGQSLVMSPALVEKYLSAGRDVASHLELLPDGIRFSEGTTRRDWTNEIVSEIRSIYLQNTSANLDMSALNTWSVANPLSVTDEDGRVDLTLYFQELIAHRDELLQDVNHIDRIADDAGLNREYLRHLADMLTTDNDNSVLLKHIRDRWLSAGVDDAGSLTAEIRTWQEQLWKFNTVGHFGNVRPWQAANSPITSARDFRVKLESAGEQDIVIRLVASEVGGASEPALIDWRNPRIERPGRPTVALRDVAAVYAALSQLREQELASTQQYLAAAFEARMNPDAFQAEEQADVRGLDPRLLSAWLRYLGISNEEVQIDEYLHQPMQGPYDFVKGWTIPGLDALSLVANSSDQKVNIPGEMNPHHVAVHPRPERWIAAGWRSPIDGTVNLQSHVRHAHPGCGNGVTWSLELAQGSQRRLLQSGVVDLGANSNAGPVESIDVREGDLVSLIIGPRDREHSCDLTEIDLSITEADGDKRTWSLAGDCANSISAGNPHADSLGNADIWHFYSGLIDGSEAIPVIPEGSLAARWLDTDDAGQADDLARQLGELLTASADVSAPDAELRIQLTSFTGPLFSILDPSALAASASVLSSDYGVDSERFGRAPDGATAGEMDLVTNPSEAIEFRLPAELFAGGEFVVSAGLNAAGSDQSAVQVQVVVGSQPTDAAAGDSLLPGIPVLVREGSAAATRMEQSLADFRDLFPIAMCYARIIPVDETVTLVLFHREDEALSRLMLDEADRERLDRLWTRLRFISQDALISVNALEQIIEFATQDADPTVFRPMRESVYQKAEDYRTWVVSAEPAHVDAMIEFAGRAYRRPLTDEENNRLRTMYADLRAADIPHEDAIRLLLTRILSAPAFLYRLEEPSDGTAATPVADTELATRLSYFLWSTLPDDELRGLAGVGSLSSPDVLLAQTRRMLGDDRVRRLAIEFGCQWLHIRDFDEFNEKSEEAFPEFAELRDDMYEESILFFTDLFQNDGSLLDVLDADHTFLNQTLAEHYGIPGVEGDQWRRVDGVDAFGRGGVLTQATVLSTQAGASRTSAILRGNWVSETLLNERLPRPPANVPILPEAPPEGLSERQLIEMHSSAPECAKCHARVDPYGFALESFDAIGRFREIDAEGQPIDTDTALRDGTPIAGLDGLTDYLTTTRRDDFVRVFCRRLLGYSLGRGVMLSDEPLIDEMMRQLAARDYHVSAAIEAIVLSEQFRKIRGMDDPRQTVLTDAE